MMDLDDTDRAILRALQKYSKTHLSTPIPLAEK